MENLQTKRKRGRKMSKITVLEVQPLKKPKVKQISTYEPQMERELGGVIEVKTPVEGNRQIAIISNADAAFQGQAICRALYSKSSPAQIEEIILGTFFIAQIDDTGQFTSLTEEQIKVYGERFQKPETVAIDSKGSITILRLKDDAELLADEEDTKQEIANLWDGKQNLRSQMVEHNEYKVLLQKACRAINKLNCVLPESMDGLFEAYIEAEHNLSRWCERESFWQGLSIGKKLVATQ